MYKKESKNNNVDKNIQIVHVHSASGTSFWRKSHVIDIAKFFGKQVIFHCHGGGFREFRLKEPAKVDAVLAKCDMIVCLSQEWEEYFDKNIDNIVDKNVLVTSMLEAATVAATEKLKQEAEWSRQIALNAVRRGTTDPEKLVFAEAKEMERSKQWEAMHRCLPMGNDFAGWLELAKETAQIEEIPLSEAMKRMDPASPLINMYSHLLKKVDNIPGVMEMDHKDVIKEVYKYSPDSYSDYNSHLEDDEPLDVLVE